MGAPRIPVQTVRAANRKERQPEVVFLDIEKCFEYDGFNEMYMCIFHNQAHVRTYC